MGWDDGIGIGIMMGMGCGGLVVGEGLGSGM